MGCVHRIVDGTAAIEFVAFALDELRHCSIRQRICFPAVHDRAWRLRRFRSSPNGFVHGCRNPVEARLSSSCATVEGLVTTAFRIARDLWANADGILARRAVLCLRNHLVLLCAGQAWLVEPIGHPG